jgi:hypothetical protein
MEAQTEKARTRELEDSSIDRLIEWFIWVSPLVVGTIEKHKTLPPPRKKLQLYPWLDDSPPLVHL